MKITPAFYYLGSPLRLRPDASVDPSYGTIEWLRKFKSAELIGVSYPPILCSLDPRHQRPGKRVGSPKLVLPTVQTSDFVWTWSNDCIVADRILRLFHGAGLTGFEANSIPVAQVKGRRATSHTPIPELWEVRVNGIGGDAHPDSGIKLLYTCSECGYQRYSSFNEGITVDPKNWDGSDFFTINGYPRLILITERTKQLIIDNKLTNCSILRTENLRWGDFPRPEDHPENFVPTKVSIKS